MPVFKRNLSTDLIWRISLALIALAALLGTLHYIVVIGPMQSELAETANEITGKLVKTLEKHLWNLDEPSIAQYIASYPMDKDAAEIRIDTQFGDPLYQTKIKDPYKPLVETRNIFHHGEHIGDITVVLSRDRIQAARANIIRFNLVLAIIGVSAVLVITGPFLSIFLTRPLHRLANEMQSLASGNYERRLPDNSKHRDIGNIYLEANAMAEQITTRTRQLQEEIAERKQKEEELQTLKASLEDLVQERTTALTEINQQLRKEVVERKRAQEEILQVCTREQQRIGRDLHDSIGQQMVASYFSANALADRLSEKLPELSGPAHQLVQLLNDGINKVRRIAKGLTGVELADEGLVLALQQLALDTQEVFGTQCTFKAGERYLIEDHNLSSHLFLVTQEAITNAIRHGQASRIEISLSLEDGRGRLTIADNGKGLPDDYENRKGLGLRTMQYRAESAGGTIAFGANEWGGTSAVCHFEVKSSAGVC